MMNLDELVQYLPALGGKYAFYYRREGQEPLWVGNEEVFSSASLIKVPILLAWATLERNGEVSLDEACDLDSEPQVRGAGFARRMRARRLPFHDVLLMMIATSDNLCANLVIERVGMDRLNRLFHDELGLADTVLQRKLMDFEARARGRDNHISARDCARMYQLVRDLPAQQLAWVEGMLLECQDAGLLLRDLERDGVQFFHKTGSIPGVFHDWGYTRGCELFLLTQGFRETQEAVRLFGLAGRLIDAKSGV